MGKGTPTYFFYKQHKILAEAQSCLSFSLLQAHLLRTCCLLTINVNVGRSNSRVLYLQPNMSLKVLLF